MERGRLQRATWPAVAAGLVCVAGALTGCSGVTAPPEHAVISGGATTTLLDQPVQLTVTGLRPGATVTVAAQAIDRNDVAWQSHADFRADAQGRVALATATPLSGTYQGAGGMGLFWSMSPTSGDPDHAYFQLPRASFDVSLTVTEAGHQIAARRLTRAWSTPAVTTRMLALTADHVVGELFLPPAGTPRHTAVLAFGGSEGGDSMVPTAALLASRGYPCLALGYFGLPGLPSQLKDIPLEYFATAARLLAAQPGVDPAHVLALGFSRGTEPALLLADRYPDLIHGAVVYSPSAVVNGGYPRGVGDAWTQDGRPIPPGTIALDHIDGPLQAFAGAQDAVWKGYQAAPEIDSELTDSHDPFPHQDVVYPGAGHEVGMYPYSPIGADAGGGGTRSGNEAAQEASWARLLAFLAADHA
jgi:dienelactone hydrolase